MNFRELLDSDVGAIWGQVRQAFAWWVDEMSALAPEGFRSQLVNRRTFTAFTDGKTVDLRDQNGHKLVLALDKQQRVDAVLAPSLYLTRTIALPQMRVADLRKMVALELDRLTPFRTEDAYFDVQGGVRNEGAGTQAVEIGVVPRDTADGVMNLLRASGLEAISLRAGGSRLDFLADIKTKGSGRFLKPTWLWAVVAFLFVLNAVVYTVRDINRLDELEAMTQSQASVVTLARRLREKVDAEATARTGLIEARAETSPLRVLDAVTRALPPNAWVQHLDWDGRALHARGYAPVGSDVRRSLARVFPKVTARLGEQSTAVNDMLPFDVTAVVPEGQGTP
jgi:general secretion pathway protein L